MRTAGKPHFNRSKNRFIVVGGTSTVAVALLFLLFVFRQGLGTDEGRKLPHRKLRTTLHSGDDAGLRPADRQLFGNVSADESGGERSAEEESRRLAKIAARMELMKSLGASMAQPMAPVPPDFDWRSYIMYHPQLFDAGITTEALAREHYVKHGQKAHWLYRRIRVIMRYSACTGLVNQLYSHIAALALAAYLGTEVVLPPAAKRDSFAHYFSLVKEQNEVQWSAAPLEDLLDVDHLISYWQQHGMQLHKAPQLLPFPDLTDSAAAFIPYDYPGADPRFSVRMPDVYQRNLELGELVDRARTAIVGKAELLLAAEPGVRLDALVLDLPCSFFMLRTISNQPLVNEIARSMRWSPTIAALADRVVAGMEATGDGDFNSLHLRIEKDARDWAAIMGGVEVVWAKYVEAMREAKFNSARSVYIASGLLTYGSHEEMDELVAKMRALGLCRSVHYKELYLPKAEIEALDSEQKALVDLLVLARGHNFVGFGASTFSFYLREYRLLHGVPPSRSVLVDASAIGTDTLFSQAGKIS